MWLNKIKLFIHQIGEIYVSHFMTTRLVFRLGGHFYCFTLYYVLKDNLILEIVPADKPRHMPREI